MKAGAPITFSVLLGITVRSMRDERSIAQATAAAALEICQPAFSRIESGQTILTVVQLRQLAKLFKTTSSEILRLAEMWEKLAPKFGAAVVAESRLPPKQCKIGRAIMETAVSAHSSYEARRPANFSEYLRYRPVARRRLG